MKYKDYIYLLVLLLIAALNFNLFLKPFNLISGGTQGVAILIHNYIKLPYAFLIFIINIVFLCLSFIFMPKKMTIGTIISTFVYPLFVFFTKSLFLNISNINYCAIIAGVISGITNGIIYRLGFSVGGIQLLPPIVYKYTKISLGSIHFFINFIILILNILIYGFHNFLYSLIIIFLNGLLINCFFYKKFKII